MLSYFPDNFAWDQTINICLGSGGYIHEIDEAAAPLRKISKQNDDEAHQAWYESWMKLAERIEKLGMSDEKEGHKMSAGRKYMRASIYYVMAERMVSNLDPQKEKAYAKVMETFRKGVEYRRYPVERVEIPYGKTTLPGLFIPSIKGGKAPCLVFFDGYDVYKEILFMTLAGGDFRERGIAMLIIDCPGNGEALRLKNLYLDTSTERPAGACVDYLEKRKDVDPDRIGVMGISLGGYYAPRAAAFEKRFKCCVGWGPAWNTGKRLTERVTGQVKVSSVPPFQLFWVTGTKTTEDALKVIGQMNLEGIADKITCPLLVVAGEHDLLCPAEDGAKLIQEAVNSPGRKLKIFTKETGGQEHVQADNVSLAIDYISDWVAEKLGGNPNGV